MKRKLAAFLCGVMCITAFTGCSDTEMAYLKMSSDMIDTMSSCKVEGNMQAEMDFDGLQEMQQEISALLYGAGYPVEESVLTGKKSVTVDYDMNMNIDTLEYDMSFDVVYEGKEYDLGTLYYSLPDGVFVTTDTLWGMYQIMREFTDGLQDQYIMSEAFAADLKKILDESEYIELVSLQYLTGVDAGAVVPKQDMTKLYDAAFTFYEDVLDGFETGMVKAVNGGYQIKADGREAMQLLVDLLYFVAEHPEQVIDATEVYMMQVMDTVEAGSPEETAAAKEEMAYLFAEARATQDDFIAAAEQMAYLAESLMQEAAVDTLLDAFSYEASVKQQGDSFVSDAVYDVTYRGRSVCSLKTDAVMKKADVQISVPQTGMTIDALKEKLAELEDEKYNPITGVSLSWGWDGMSDYVDIHTMRSNAEGVYFGSNYNWSELIVADGRAYVPLRMIADILGEEVGWEKDTKIPYVMKDGERVDMKGKLQYGRTFVAVRDFEKLGYTVSFEKYEDGFKVVQITK